MKPGKGRKDRAKGGQSFGRSAGKKIERSAVARPERRDNRRDDRDSDKRFSRSGGKNKDPRNLDRRDGKPVFDRRDRDFKRPDRGEKRYERRGAAQDVVAGKNSVVEALRAKIPAKELVVAHKTEIDERISEAIRLAKNLELPIKEMPRRALDDLTGGANHQGIALVIKPFN